MTTNGKSCATCQGQADELETLRAETVELRRRLAATEFDPAKFAAKVFVIRSRTEEAYYGRHKRNIVFSLGKAWKWSVKGEAQAALSEGMAAIGWHVYQPTAQEILAAEAEAAVEWVRERSDA